MPNLIFMLLCTLLELPLVSSSNKKIGVEIGSHHLEILDDKHMMRREQRVRDVQSPGRLATTTTTTLNLAQAKPNDKLCACNGCLLPGGFCSSVYFRTTSTSEKCIQQGGKWCLDKPKKTLWAADDTCWLLTRFRYLKSSLTMMKVTFSPLPITKNVKYVMTDTSDGNSVIARLPCIDATPKFPDNATSVWVQGYYEDPVKRADWIRSILTEPGVPPEFLSNQSYFLVLNIQDTATLASDVEKKTQSQVITDTMAGALRAHWSPQMTIAVAMVTCPGTGLNADRQKVQQAFFTDFADAIKKASRGKISVSGGVTAVVIDCPANTSNSDAYSYFQAVNSGLRSDPIWINSEHKAMVIPNGWISTYGLAYSPGKLSWYSDLGGQDAANIMHEMGHNFGLDHAAIIPSNNPTGYDEHGDCSSAMSNCDSIMTYTLAANWFLGFNTFQQVIDISDVTSPVSVKVTSQSQLAASGVLLTRRVEGKDVPAFTVSYLRRADVPEPRRKEMMPWIERIYVHELPATAYGPTRNVAFLGLLNFNRRPTYRIRDFSLAITVTAQDQDTATVTFCKANSDAAALTCGAR
jgi:hypothetical protein